MELLSDPTVTKKNTNQSQIKNSSHPLLSKQWKSEQDYKKEIMSLEIQNQKYRNELYQLGQTVNKILDKVKVSASLNKSAVQKVPNLQQQLQLVKKELHNVNQFIDIYQKQLAVLNAKKKKDQNQTIASTQQVLKQKSEQLAQIRKQVKQLSHKNKGLQYRLLQYSKKGKAKSADQQALQLKQLITQNKNLKYKLQQLKNLHERKQKWLESNIASANELQSKVKEKQMKLPKIQSNRTSQEKQRTASSLPKLQSQKKIYTKWLQTVAKKNSDPIDKEIQQLQKMNTMMQTKITNTSSQIQSIQDQIEKLKQKISQYEDQVEIKQQKKSFNKKSIPQTLRQKSLSKASITQEISSTKQKKKHIGTMVTKRLRKMRKDWVGKFDGMRFSDNRYVRQQSRLYKLIFNTNGYCQFFYYSCRDNKQRINSKLPFDTSNLLNQGKDSSFTVQYPDFIKNIRLKINIKTHRVTALTVISNLGIEGQFVVDNTLGSGSKAVQKTVISSKQEQPEVSYQMDVKTNQAITCMFGSYGYKLDEKKQIIGVWLQGLGVQLIEDFVQELI